MARKPREETEGGIFHVFARGNRRQRIYLDDVDRRRYLRLLQTVVAEQRWRCLAYCLMENHVHLLVETPAANLAGGMQRLHGWYAESFNARHRHVGHLFQGRYGAAGSGAPDWLDARRLLSHFASAGGEPGQRYAQFVNDG
jgi:putative transposase